MVDDGFVQRRILLVENEESLILTLRDRLESERYEVTVARDGESALETGSRNAFDCIVLDVALPRKNGFDVCRDLRIRGVQTPILILTARGQLIDRVLGLKLGADDYLTKPFEMIELLARIEALRRRARTLTASSADAYSFGRHRRLPPRRGQTRQHPHRPLRPRAQTPPLPRRAPRHRPHEGRAPRKSVGYDATPVTRTVDVHIGSLRQKLGGEFILTVHGIGYKFVG